MQLIKKTLDATGLRIVMLVIFVGYLSMFYLLKRRIQMVEVPWDLLDLTLACAIAVGLIFSFLAVFNLGRIKNLARFEDRLLKHQEELEDTVRKWKSYEAFVAKETAKRLKVDEDSLMADWKAEYYKK